MVMKGLPLTYAKDMQEDKETTFDALRSFAVAVAAMRGMIEDLEPDPDAMRAAAERGYATATDLADWLVRELKLPFREAHHVTGRHRQARGGPGDRRSRTCRSGRCRRWSRASRRASFPFSAKQIPSSSRTSFGGTAPQNVRKMARTWIKRLEKDSGKG